MDLFIAAAVTLLILIVIRRLTFSSSPSSAFDASQQDHSSLEAPLTSSNIDGRSAIHSDWTGQTPGEW